MSKLKKVILVMILTIVAVIAVISFNSGAYAKTYANDILGKGKDNTLYAEDVSKGDEIGLWSHYGERWYTCYYV